MASYESHAAKFWAQVTIGTPYECWMWNGNRFRSPVKYGSIKTYGRYHLGERVYIKAHRLAFILAKGPIPKGLYICHHCDNPSCVNPAHLFAGTAKDNRRDQDSKLRHNKGEAVNTAKLTSDQVLEIIAEFQSRKDEYGIYSTLGRKYGVSNGHIHNIVKGRNWKHLTVGPRLSIY